MTSSVWFNWVQCHFPVFPEPLFFKGQLTPFFENQGSMQIFEDQLKQAYSQSRG